LNNAAAVDELTARLAHLCRLIVRDRHPLCPLNGILLLVPLAGTDHPQDATETGHVCHLDLATVRAGVRVRCPLFILGCDVETVAGGTEFIGEFNDRERLQRVGQRCPLVPDFRHSDFAAGKQGPVAEMLDSLSGWICNSVVPAWVYKSFRVENSPGSEGVAA